MSVRMLRIPVNRIPRYSSLHTSSLLCNSTTPPTTKTVPIALISKIRSLRPGTPLSLARSSLQATSNDVDAAIAWLAAQAAASGAKKAERLKGRVAEQGLVGVALMRDGLASGKDGMGGVRACIVELSCETDFVARTGEFGKLLEDVTRSLAFFAEAAAPSSGSVSGGEHFVHHVPETVLDTPLVPALSATSTSIPFAQPGAPHPTVGSSIATTISLLGESISLRRAVTVSIDPSASTGPAYLASTYLHGTTPTPAGSTTVKDLTYSSGTLASLILARLPTGFPPSSSPEIEISTKSEIHQILRALARQVVAVPTEEVRSSSSDDAVKSEEEGGEVSKALYSQPVMTLSPTSVKGYEFEQGARIESLLQGWSASKGLAEAGSALEVLELVRWEVGGGGSGKEEEG